MRFRNLLLYHGEGFNPNFYYLSGLTFQNAFLIIKNGKKTIITNLLNRGLGRGFQGKFLLSTDLLRDVKRLVRGRTVEIDGRMPVRLYLKLNIKAEDCTEKLYRMRAQKRLDEVAKIKIAARLTRSIVDGVSIREGRTEKEIADELLSETYAQGVEPAFNPIVATGGSAVSPHAIPGNKKIADYVLIDYGVRYKHYCADITRCFFFKTKKGKRVEEIYDKIRDVACRIVDECAGAKNSGEITMFYEQLNKKYGLPKPLHSVGHGIGLEVHEYPRFGKKYNDPIKKTTFTIEPAAYFGNFGVRYEETIFHNGKRLVVL
ncbi:MAG: M24 family metallopeptidase [Candidatus Bilamarchaeaceae archaeon]